ncbi:hypothetical protein HYFRA_00010412 [Hymenoscyphus fraxineus]|uniref:Uncharacterized protein n=1 Tax=Hymenoscyphus fraxineus TaxID=746836 RepID=A0A9N9PS27_9HELO|nr:hypothetical protein HYFRA_00010412 [Hymenoscyphus fraxineus]
MTLFILCIKCISLVDAIKAHYENIILCANLATLPHQQKETSIINWLSTIPPFTPRIMLTYRRSIPFPFRVPTTPEESHFCVYDLYPEAGGEDGSGGETAERTSRRILEGRGREKTGLEEMREDEGLLRRIEGIGDVGLELGSREGKGKVGDCEDGIEERTFMDVVPAVASSHLGDSRLLSVGWQSKLDAARSKAS